MPDPPKITVGILDRRAEVRGRLWGCFRTEGISEISGRFLAKAETGRVTLFDDSLREIARSPCVKLTGQGHSSFSLSDVTIGGRFHWERTEDQTFRGDLILLPREDGAIAAINEISLEEYLSSVISSEMNAAAPIQFLKAHAIVSRSWLLAGLRKKKKPRPAALSIETAQRDEAIRWYDRGEHDLFDVCADDHCQRYQGLPKTLSERTEEAVHQTYGRVILYQNEICDARYSKACGGLTEEFATAWEEREIPYLESISDASITHRPIRTEEEARRWVLSDPQAFCNTEDERLLETILSEVDRETKNFFRWRVEYSQDELRAILREKSGTDFGTLREMIPLRRGPSGRISRLRIVGSKRSMTVGKELEIRRWLSRSHLYSSAFAVTFEGDRVIFNGAGWGHGVGLCQIGAAVMASRGFSAEQILKHYFRGVEIDKIY